MIKGKNTYKRRGGSILRQAALPALLTGLLFATPKRRTRKPVVLVVIKLIFKFYL